MLQSADKSQKPLQEDDEGLDYECGEDSHGKSLALHERRQLLHRTRKSEVSSSGLNGVLKTNDSLRSCSQMFVGTGQSRSSRDSNSLRWGESGSILTTSAGLQGIPDMKSLFKMYGKVAIQKAASTDLLCLDNDEIGRTEEFSTSTYASEESICVTTKDDDPTGSDFFVLDPSQIYSKRKQLVHEYQKWPLYWDRPIDFQEASYILVGALPVPENKVCESMPQGFRGEGTFIVRYENAHRSDSNHDSLGFWGRPTGRNRYYGNSSTGIFTRMDDGRGNLLPNSKYIWKCMMRRYEHPMTASVNGGKNRFIKKIYSALHPPEYKEKISFVVITYEWIGKPFSFKVTPLPSKNRRGGTSAPHPPPGSKDWQAASFHGAMAALPATCSAYFGECPLYAVGAVDFNVAASIILGGTIVEPSKICNSVPQGYRECGTFVIDLCSFATDAELRRDDNGCWGKPAGHSRYYKIDSETGDAVRVDRGCKLIEGAEYDIQILSKRYEHPSVNGRFVRKIYTGRSPSNSRIYEICMTLAVMTYYWKGEPEHFEAGPQRKVIVPEGAERQRVSRHEFASKKDYIPSKRPRKTFSDDTDESAQTMMYRNEYELQERQADLLGRLELFMDRLDRISMCLPRIQEPLRHVWMREATCQDNTAHEEEIILENVAYDG